MNTPCHDFEMWSRFLKKTAKDAMSRRIYLDYAAATPMFPEAVAAMRPFLETEFANPGGIHREGVAAKRALEGFRTEVARVLEIPAPGVIFTSGGTESNNLAITGTIERLHQEGRPYASMTVLSTALEHPATRRTLEALKTKGVVVRDIPVTEEGLVTMSSLRVCLDESVVLVTLAYVNSEMGAITDCRAVRRQLDEAENAHGTSIIFHVDAAQAPLWLPCALPRLGADLVSFDGGKCGGGKGIGMLAMRKGVTVSPLLYGGGQEAGIRPGTEPVHLVAALATAFRLAQMGVVERTCAVQGVRDYAFTQITEVLPQAVVNGPRGNNRVANNIHISIPGIDAEFAVITLDAKGIAASTKSACSSKGGGASAVIMAMTGDEARAMSTLRFTLGPNTCKADIDTLMTVLVDHINKQAMTLTI